MHPNCLISKLFWKGIIWKACLWDDSWQLTWVGASVLCWGGEASSPDSTCSTYTITQLVQHTCQQSHLWLCLEKHPPLPLTCPPNCPPLFHKLFPPSVNDDSLNTQKIFQFLLEFDYTYHYWLKSQWTPTNEQQEGFNFLLELRSIFNRFWIINSVWLSQYFYLDFLFVPILTHFCF